MVMTRTETLEHVLANMRSYAQKGNFAAATRLNEQALTVLLDAAFDQDRVDLAHMRERFALFRSEMNRLLHEPTSSKFAASLDANIVFSTIASRRRPKAVEVRVDAEASSARDAALAVLKRYGSLSTGELAEKVGVRKETMSRTLTALKAEGLVTSQRAGRSIKSRLTARGRKAMGLESGAHRIELSVRQPEGLEIKQLFRDAGVRQVRNSLKRGAEKAFKPLDMPPVPMTELTPPRAKAPGKPNEVDMTDAPPDAHEIRNLQNAHNAENRDYQRKYA